MSAQVYRSALMTSALRLDRFYRGIPLPADVHFIDLEDGVPTTAKTLARNNFLSLASRVFPCSFGVRVNSLRSASGLDDVAAFIESTIDPDVILLPKVETPDEVQLYDSWMTAAGKSGELWALIETVQGFRNIYEIAESTPRLTTLNFGVADYAAEMGASMEWEAMLNARSRVVEAARATQRLAVDSPTLDLRDSDSLRSDAERAYKLGFSGKVVIHPDQLSIVNSSFAHSIELIEWARKVLSKLDVSPQSIDTVDGQMVGPPFVRKARDILNATPLDLGRIVESAP